MRTSHEERPTGRKSILVVMLLGLVLVFANVSCGDDDPPSNKWDRMQWDKGSWGAVEFDWAQLTLS